jgi:hypothetical protein
VITFESFYLKEIKGPDDWATLLTSNNLHIEVDKQSPGGLAWSQAESFFKYITLERNDEEEDENLREVAPGSVFIETKLQSDPPLMVPHPEVDKNLRDEGYGALLMEVALELITGANHWMICTTGYEYYTDSLIAPGKFPAIKDRGGQTSDPLVPIYTAYYNERDDVEKKLLVQVPEYDASHAELYAMYRKPGTLPVVHILHDDGLLIYK